MSPPAVPSAWDRASGVLLAFSLALSTHGSPVTVQATTGRGGVLPGTFGSSPATWVKAGGEHVPGAFDPLQVRAWCQGALSEVEAARRVLDALRDDSAPEAATYLTELESTLDQFTSAPEVSPHKLPLLVSGLRSARERLEAGATTWHRWARVTRAARNDPDGWLPVPERFVVRVAPESEPDALPPLDAADLRVQRMVDAFWGHDADRSPS